MGTWDLGPFDNDNAADWAGELDDLPAAERVEFLRQTLRNVAEGPEEAVAAAAVVAAHLPAGPAITSTYGPEDVAPGSLLVDEELRGLARRTLDIACDPAGPLVQAWEESGLAAEAVAALAPVHAALRGA